MTADVIGIDVGGGDLVRMDRPSEEVIAATKRMADALAAGHEPLPADATLVLSWTQEQEAKYGPS
jgi:hypothetical protein